VRGKGRSHGLMDNPLCCPCCLRLWLLLLPVLLLDYASLLLLLLVSRRAT
jgi:hypothetical protein